MASASIVSPKDIASKEYNFVIIGGGTAGLTLAARLTEDPAVNVLVLEAGEDKPNDPKINIPALFSQLYEDPDYDWGFKTVPQPALNNRVVAQPRGKVLGGSSAINFMMMSHASKEDIDNWAQLGNPGWDYETLEPYYRKFETYNAPEVERAKDLGSEIINPALHGSSGPVQITFPWATSQLDHAFRPTLQTLGLGAEADPKAGATLGGYSILRFIDKGGKRSSAASAFYAPNASRSNLTVLTNAHVGKIILESEAGKLVTAKGVLFSIDGEELSVAASNEVLLCAGSYQSPQVLELSGIGSRSILENFDIKVVIDNPNVGENLQDHILAPLQFEANEGLPTAETIKQPGVLDWALGEWMAGRGGPLATGVSGTGFLTYSSLSPENSTANLATIQNQLADIPTGIASKQFEIQRSVFFNNREADIQINFAPAGFNPYSGEKLAGLFTHEDPGNYVGAAAALTHPFSRGNVHIASADPRAAPIIDPRYLNHPVDLEVMSAGILFIQKLSETKPLADLIKDNPETGGKRIQPSYKLDTRVDKEMAETLVKAATISSWHPLGTCSMLPEAEGGVVDTKLMVYGTANLRVIDASVMPLHVRGNISSAVYAVAERAADIIKENFGIKSV